MRLADSGRETDIRLVGRLGEDRSGNVYGVAFCDPNLESIWTAAAGFRVCTYKA